MTVGEQFVRHLRQDLLRLARRQSEETQGGRYLSMSVGDAARHVEEQLVTFRELFVSCALDVNASTYMALRDELRNLEASVNELRWVIDDEKK
jgi:hypothetical protein